LEGVSVIAALVDQARERIAIMAGGGRMRNLIGVVSS
jgi:copper homeostasis protein CutC